jgi:hypothetical protein
MLFANLTIRLLTASMGGRVPPGGVIRRVIPQRVGVIIDVRYEACKAGVAELAAGGSAATRMAAIDPSEG